MSDTSLSPRLRHLLIQEDRRTGRLIKPEDRDRPSSPVCIDRSSSTSPRLLVTPDQYVRPPVYAPGHYASNQLAATRKGRPSPPQFTETAVKEHDAGSMSPPRSPGSVSDGYSEREMLDYASPDLPPPLQQRHSLAHGLYRQAPFAGPSPQSDLPPPFPERYPQQQHGQQVRRGSIGPVSRPEMYRRHTSHPYEYHPAHHPASAAAASAAAMYRPIEYTPIAIGGRMPISRTTKACNACRSRKVRCDAGGSGSPEPTTCSRCREAGVACVYSGAQKKRGPCPGIARPAIPLRRPSSQHGEGPMDPPHYSPPTRPAYPPSRSSYSGYPSRPEPGLSRSYPPPGHPHPHHPHAHPYHIPHRPSAPAALPSHYHSVRPMQVDVRPPPPPHHDAYPPSATASRKPSVLSWPHMEAATDAPSWPVKERVVKDYEAEYDMRSPGAEARRGSFFGGEGRSLPPLRMAIGGRTGYFEP